MTFSDRELLARLIQCKAGDKGDNAMRAVAGTVMNRVNIPYGEYSRVSKGGDIRAIILQPEQYVCASQTEQGQNNQQNIYNMRPAQIHYDIADWAIAGGRLYDMGESLWFFNPLSPDCLYTFPNASGEFAARIGEHCFYNPTEAYKLT